MTPHGDMGEAAKTRRALIVIGCHRSGTSAMARTLSLCGAELPTGLVGADPGNPKGHWEPYEVGRLSDEIFRTLGSGWNSLFGPPVSRLSPEALTELIARAREIIRRNYTRDMIVFKDPRVSLLLPIWRPALEQEGYEVCPVVMVRHPADVAESLFLRDGLPRNHGMVLWLTYLLTLEPGLRDLRKCYVSYADLALDPEDQLDRIEAAFGGGMFVRTWGALLDVETFLHRARGFDGSAAQAELSARFPEPLRYYESLLRLTRDEPADGGSERRAAEWWSGQQDIYGPIVQVLEADAYSLRDQRTPDVGRY